MPDRDALIDQLFKVAPIDTDEGQTLSNAELDDDENITDTDVQRLIEDPAFRSLFVGMCNADYDDICRLAEIFGAAG